MVVIDLKKLGKVLEKSIHYNKNLVISFFKPLFATTKLLCILHLQEAISEFAKISRNMHDEF